MPLQNFCKYTILNSLNHILKVGKFVDGFNEFVRGRVSWLVLNHSGPFNGKKWWFINI